MSLLPVAVLVPIIRKEKVDQHDLDVVSEYNVANV
jgi:hypothetical protein